VGPVLKFFVNYFGHPSRLKAALTNKEKSCIFEEIADQAVDAGFTELGMKFYSEMLKFAELDGDKERIYLACSSLSETARDMHDYKCAIEYQERCVRLVHKLYPDDEYKVH
jgi:hypothetical protein